MIYFNALAILIGFATLLWLVSLYLKNSSIVDPFWGLLFVVAIWFYFFETEIGDLNRKHLLLALVTIWGVRLSTYLFWRNWGEEEDYRYQKFRKNWGKHYWWGSLLQVFWLQAFLAWLISYPLFIAQVSEVSLNWLDFVGVGVWLIGFIFEAGGDWQLTRFKSNPENKGKLLTTGLWKYTRHPNYFGDTACWWGYGLIALASGSYLQLFAPLLMTYLLLKISGVAMVERGLKKTKPGYEEYVRRTSAFLPWWPKE